MGTLLAFRFWSERNRNCSHQCSFLALFSSFSSHNFSPVALTPRCLCRRFTAIRWKPAAPLILRKCLASMISAKFSRFDSPCSIQQKAVEMTLMDVPSELLKPIDLNMRHFQTVLRQSKPTVASSDLTKQEEWTRRSEKLRILKSSAHFRPFFVSPQFRTGRQLVCAMIACWQILEWCGVVRVLDFVGVSCLFVRFSRSRLFAFSASFSRSHACCVVSS